jgi:tryptophanyl-tRNA synthetase
MAKKLFFSGIQPTGELHIGNYLGAIQRWVKLVDSGEYEGIMCVVDYHAMTVPYEQATLKQRSLEAATMLMACGISADKALLFIQSYVPQHTELAWVLNCSCMIGELSRMTQFKDKSKDKGESVAVGLFTYPVLMAADILLYKAAYVPVGEDQIQHLELAREIVRRFNSRFGETFPEPQPLIGEAKRIMGLDGESKMSKSMGNTIALSESPESIWKKLAPAKTDERRKKRSDPGVPTDCNVYMSYHRYFSPAEDLAYVDKGCRSAGIGCLECKKLLAKNMEKELGPIRKRYEDLRQHPQKVEAYLNESAEKCRAIAEATMHEVRSKIGVR